MTLDGAVNKTAICCFSLMFFWMFFIWMEYSTLIWPHVRVFRNAIVGFILALVTIFRNPSKARSTAPLYALAQGIFLGGITLMYENMFDGIAIQAIGLTFGILASLLIAYKSGLIKPTENFKLMMFAGNWWYFIALSG